MFFIAKNHQYLQTCMFTSIWEVLASESFCSIVCSFIFFQTWRQWLMFSLQRLKIKYVSHSSLILEVKYNFGCYEITALKWNNRIQFNPCVKTKIHHKYHISLVVFFLCFSSSAVSSTYMQGHTGTFSGLLSLVLVQNIQFRFLSPHWALKLQCKLDKHIIKKSHLAKSQNIWIMLQVA